MWSNRRPSGEREALRGPELRQGGLVLKARDTDHSERIALHEAAHATAAYLFGHTIHGIKVKMRVGAPTWRGPRTCSRTRSLLSPAKHSSSRIAAAAAI